MAARLTSVVMLTSLARIRPWLGTAARVILGVVWIVAGATKFDDLAASGRAVAAYHIFPYDVATFLGATLPFIEIALGLLLLLGFATRVSAFISGLLLVGYIVGIASAWIRGLRIDCGCFSHGGELTSNEQSQYLFGTIRDIALVAVAGFLAVFPRTHLSIDGALESGDET